MKTRSPFFFERRRQLRSASWPSPEFAPQHSSVHRLPGHEGFLVSALVVGTGTPPPDTPAMSDWSVVPSSTGNVST